jgi:hypothetical protein
MSADIKRGGASYMNKKLNLLVMLVGLLALSFISISCLTTGSGNSGTAPGLTDFITLNHENGVNQQWIPETSFKADDGINVAGKGYDLEGGPQRLILSAKRQDGSDVGKWELKIKGKEYNQFWGSFNFSPGDYTFEVYVVDAKGNQSNTLSTMFTVNDL